MILEGAISVNGQIVRELGVKVDPDSDVVLAEGKPVQRIVRGVLLLHKPIHVVSTMSDPQGRPTVADYLTKPYRSYFPVGRLDFDSSGLIVMTNDGELADRLMHPRYQSVKRYQVAVSGRMPDGVLANLEKGIVLEDGPVKCKISVLRDLDDATELGIELTEGRHRIVRRMLDAVGFPVLSLHRTHVGPLRIGTIPPGGLRKLSQAEYEALRREVIAVGNAGSMDR